MGCRSDEVVEETELGKMLWRGAYDMLSRSLQRCDHVDLSYRNQAPGLMSSRDQGMSL
jgi:hypothetical protein